jgi:hypothetical protein
MRSDMRSIFTNISTDLDDFCSPYIACIGGTWAALAMLTTGITGSPFLFRFALLDCLYKLFVSSLLSLLGSPRSFVFIFLFFCCHLSVVYSSY